MIAAVRLWAAARFAAATVAAATVAAAAAGRAVTVCRRFIAAASAAAPAAVRHQAGHCQSNDQGQVECSHPPILPENERELSGQLFARSRAAICRQCKHALVGGKRDKSATTACKTGRPKMPTGLIGPQNQPSRENRYNRTRFASRASTPRDRCHKKVASDRRPRQRQRLRRFFTVLRR